MNHPLNVSPTDPTQPLAHEEANDDGPVASALWSLAEKAQRLEKEADEASAAGRVGEWLSKRAKAMMVLEEIRQKVRSLSGEFLVPEKPEPLRVGAVAKRGDRNVIRYCAWCPTEGRDKLDAFEVVAHDLSEAAKIVAHMHVSHPDLRAVEYLVTDGKKTWRVMIGTIVDTRTFVRSITEETTP